MIYQEQFRQHAKKYIHSYLPHPAFKALQLVAHIKYYV